jgi:hypothetical protein
MAFDEGYIKDRMLLKVGSQSIGGSTDDTKRRRTVDAIYDGIVYETFHRHIWHFATTRIQLVELATTPAFGWLHQYAYPPGCVRIIKTLDENARTINYDYKREVVLSVSAGKTVETDVMLTDQEKVFVLYVYLRKDPASWPGWFQKLVILSGAKELVGPIKKDDFTALNIKNDLALALSEAKGANAAENLKVGNNLRTIDAGNRDFIEAPTAFMGPKIWNPSSLNRD